MRGADSIIECELVVKPLNRSAAVIRDQTSTFLRKRFDMLKCYFIYFIVYKGLSKLMITSNLTQFRIHFLKLVKKERAGS